MRILSVLLLMATSAVAEGERSGDFDYYVLSLSWSPNWCAREGDAKGSAQCDADKAYGWVLHGLWPQYEDGWPSYCPTNERNPSRADTAAQADLYGTSGSAWHQWNKHGRCSGLSSEDYYAISREAYDRINRPEIFRKLTQTVRLPASVVEQAFLEANSSLSPNEITITCKKSQIQEARICLTRDLNLRECGADLKRDCALSDAIFKPLKN